MLNFLCVQHFSTCVVHPDYSIKLHYISLPLGEVPDVEFTHTKLTVRLSFPCFLQRLKISFRTSLSDKC